MTDETGQTVRIRAMVLADLDQVFALADSLAHAPRWAREVYEAGLTSGSAPRRMALVAEEPASGAVAGFAVAAVVGPEAELESLAVAEKLQRRGIGRQLVDEIVGMLGQEGVTKVFLEVRESNRPAQRLYDALGFKTAGRRASYYPEPKEDAVVMALSLGGDPG
jgi:ribosomal-protein-alanine N-acetyltransferase